MATHGDCAAPAKADLRLAGDSVLLTPAAYKGACIVTHSKYLKEREKRSDNCSNMSMTVDRPKRVYPNGCRTGISK